MNPLDLLLRAWRGLRQFARNPLTLRLLLAVPLLRFAGRVPQAVVRLGPPQSVQTANP